MSTHKFEGYYLKMNMIEQNDKGNVFAIAYQDYGVFNVQVRDNEGNDLALVEVSEILGWNNQGIDRKEAKKNLNLPLTEFYEPFITCVFLPGDDLFIQVYHRFHKKQYSFTYSYKEQRMLSDVEIHSVSNATIRNFPIKTFYSHENREIYTFYRQG